MIPSPTDESQAHTDLAWSQDLYRGAPGIALHLAEQARHGDEAGPLHPYIRMMTSSSLEAHPGTGLYRGAPAVAFALRAALRPAHPTYPAYSAALDVLDSAIADLIRTRLDHARNRRARGELPHLREFDVVSGITGLGAYLLYRDPADPLLHDVARYLVDLTRPIHANGATLPGWWTHTAPTGRPSPGWGRGHGNTGLAHGIAGPLALLAHLHRRQITIPGLAEAMTTILDWYDSIRAENRRGTWWPEILTDPLPRPLPGHARPDRPAWCYGTPGIARAQQLAALALGDQTRASTAEQILADCLSDPEQLDRITDMTVCHGLAGVVMTTWRAAQDAGPESPLHQCAAELRSLLAESPDLPLAAPLPDTGLFLGRDGIELTLLTTSSDDPQTSTWDRCLLIAG